MALRTYRNNGMILKVLDIFNSFNGHPKINSKIGGTDICIHG